MYWFFGAISNMYSLLMSFQITPLITHTTIPRILLVQLSTREGNLQV